MTTTSCKLTVTFKPTAINSRSASSLNFGNQRVATTSAPQTVGLSNCGTDDLTFASITLVGTNPGDFALTDNCSAAAPLKPTTGCTLIFTFTPTAINNRSASLAISDNAPFSPHSVSLFGTGATPQVCLSASSLNFGNQRVATTSAPQTVVVNNCGTDVLTFTSITMTGTNPGDFALTNNCTAPLDPTTSCTLILTFTPTAINNRSAAVTIADDAPFSPHSVLLFGVGASPQVCSSHGVLGFGQVAVFSSSPAQTVLLTNCGIDVLSITSVALTGTNPGDFTLTNDSCTGASLAVQESCSVDLTFQPQAAGNRTANLTATDNAPGSPHNIVFLSGTGV